MNFLSADVPDPTDFPPQAVAPGLRTLDGSFRCDICGELYDAPVTISCGHCFCSGCIRTSLSIKQECPSCRKTTDEAHIRPNPVLESVTNAWKDARPFVLGLVRREEEERAMDSHQSDKGTARKRKRMTERSSSADAMPENVAGPSRNSLSPFRVVSKSPSRSKKSKTKSEDVVDMTISGSDAEEDELTAPPSNLVPKANDLVACPICQKKVRYRNLNAHMDNNCKNASSSENTAESWSKIMGGGKNGQQKGKHKKKASDSDDEHPLPISTYTTLKDRQLKDMLTHHDLPLTGDRSNWEQRHQKWVMLFNANLDKSLPNRKTKAELRRDLKKWEDISKKKKIVITDVKRYQIEQKSEFARLTEVARPPKKIAPPAGNKSSSPSTIPDRTSPPPRSSITEVGDSIVVDSEGEHESNI